MAWKKDSPEYKKALKQKLEHNFKAVPAEVSARYTQQSATIKEEAKVKAEAKKQVSFLLCDACRHCRYNDRGRTIGRVCDCGTYFLGDRAAQGHQTCERSVLQTL